MVEIRYTNEAYRVVMSLCNDERDPTYDRLLEELDCIAENPEEARFAAWSSYVSSRAVYGTKIPGGGWTVFWRPEGGLLVVYLFQDAGV